MERKNKELMRVEYSAAIALVSYAVWTAIYGWFALHFDDDPEACFASNASDQRLITNINPEHDTDVGSTFRTCFSVLFYTSLACLFVSLVISCVKSETLQKCLSILAALAQYSLTFCVLFLFVTRYRHPGRVCSGDFLKDTDSEEGYLI